MHNVTVIHHSLNSQCSVIREYRADLREEVNKALESGKLNRNGNTNTQAHFDMKNEAFPPLGKSKQPQHSAWNNVQTGTHNDTALDSTKLLLRINENMIEMRESNRRVEEKLDKIESKVNQTALDAELHQTTLVSLIGNVQSLIQNVLGPAIQQIKPELVKSETGLQSIYDNLRNLKTKLNDNYEIRRKRPSSPPMSSISDKQTTTSEITIGDITFSNKNHK